MLYGLIENCILDTLEKVCVNCFTVYNSTLYLNTLISWWIVRIKFHAIRLKDLIKGFVTNVIRDNYKYYTDVLEIAGDK